MATQFSTLLKIALPTQGELSGSWGDVVNNNITSMVEEAIAGLKTINTWSGNSATLSTANGTTAESRAAMLLLTDTTSDLSGAATLICPALSKVFIVKNGTGQTVTVKTSSGTGVAVSNGNTSMVFCDGTNVVEAVTGVTGNLDIGGNLTVGGNATVTGTTTFNGGTITLGDANTDNIVFGGEVDSNIIPDDDGTYDLGSSSKEWKDIYIDGTAYIDAVSLDGTAITATAAEINILDGVTATTAEINLIDGGATVGTTAIADGDGLIINDAGTMRVSTVQTLAAYLDDEITAMPNLVTTAATTVGTLNSGAVSSGFGNIDIGSSNLTATGTISLGAASFNDNNITNVGSIQLDSIAGDADTNTSITFSGSDVITMATGGTTAITIDASQNVTVAGDLTISGDDLTMATNTAGHLLIADGTNFNPTAVGSLSEISTVANDDVFLAVDTSGGGLKKITRSAVVAGLATSSAISNVSEDSTPQLGGSLDVNSQDIVSTSNGNITLTPNGSGVVRVDGTSGIDMQSGGISIKNGGAESYIRFYCESSNAHYSQLQASPHSAYSGNVTLVLPASADTLVGRATTDTLTNKTLTAPKIADGGFIADANGNELVIFQTTGSAVNQLEITNNASGSNPILAATGGDTNIGIALTPKGTGEIVIGAGNLNYGGTAVTSTGAELNILDGVTSTATELNLIDGSSAGTIVNSKAVIYGSSGEVNATTLQIAGTSITSTAAELNILDGVTSTTAELNILDGVTSTAAELNALDGITAVVGELNALDLGSTAVGTAIASKAVILDSNKDYTGIRNFTLSGELDAGSLDIEGDADINGTLEADAITIGNTAIASIFSPIAGGSSIVTTGALNAGSITSGFGTIDNGASAITTTGVITGGTLEATTDTAAGDNAAIGYTSGEGLILTGQGSTSDVTIKNDADATVASIATGTTIFTMADDVFVTGRAAGTMTTDNDGSLDLAVSNNFKVTTGGDLTLTFTNPAIGQSGNILFINASNHTISAHASILINADVLTAISASGSYHLTYYATATSGNNTILVSASAILT